MLDGILGRGFSAKCKSLMKMIKSRNAMIRRKRSATLKFLKKDVADLLAAGLDINAYGRAEGLVVELILSSCYDFVERCCDHVLKHLSVMQTMRHCPEDCRDAVSSIMFAAARFSDLRELRDLRQLFLERYGDSLELYVNPWFVENMSAKPVLTETKVQLLQDIASEFSIRWDSRGLEQRMSKVSPVQDLPRTYGASLSSNLKSDSPNDKSTTGEGAKRHFLPNGRQEQKHNGFGVINEEKQAAKREELNLHSRNEGLNNANNKPQNGVDKQSKLGQNKDDLLPLRRQQNLEHELMKENTPVTRVGLGSSLSQKKQHASGHGGADIDDSIRPKPEPSPPNARLRSNGDSIDSLAPKPARDAHDNEPQKQKSFYNGAIPPPPYTRPIAYKPKDSNPMVNAGSTNAVPHANSIDTSRTEQINLGHKSDTNDSKMHRDEHVYDTQVYYEGDSVTTNPIPKPRSLRRIRNSRSQPDDVNMGSVEPVKRRSRSRRTDGSRQEGAQTSEGVKDEEEMMLDEMLIHYSKKPSFYDPAPETVRSHPGRSISLPSDQPSTVQVFTRAASFEPAARHVHPKLPDYDDLAARFAALKS